MTPNEPSFYKLQDLPPKAAHFCLSVERFCRDLPEPGLAGASVLLAYSGGADSKALLFSLYFLAPRLGITLHAATLDHCLRPESAGEVGDAANLCSRLGIPFHTRQCDVAALAREKGVGLEEAGRLARLDFYAAIRAASGCRWVAVGHHLNDLAEDSVMRMVRGGGWPAIAGMDVVSMHTGVVRPLLLTPRADIECFLREIGENWVRDAMNEDEAYLRNRVRKHIVPQFLAENPSFLDTVATRWRMARDDAAFFAALVDAVGEERVGGDVFLAREALLQTPAAVRLRKYMAVLSQMGKGQASAVLLYALDAAWSRGEGGKTVQFPGGKSATVKNGGILFTRQQAASA